ncbi:MAG TPA: sugar phosphate isomerase/epimerase family protein [Terriglobia bacterium]|nr:sugar phosphate isomerase/epimerase family protein [Terriglobia bacterium]
MNNKYVFSRRSFLSFMAAAPLAAAVTPSKQIPVGLELYSVRDELDKDLTGTVRGVAKIGYQCVEFYGPYYEWTTDYARKVRAELDELGIHCYSTHNDLKSFTPEGVGKAIDLNKILGTRYIVLAHPGDVNGLDGYKRVAEMVNKANDTMKRQGLHAGYHNHDAEWKPIDGQKPMEILRTALDKSIMLQLDVGTCLAAGGDPVAWINHNPGRIRSMHVKDWSPQREYKVLTGEGIAPWKKMFAAAETTGGIEYYLIEQEGSDFPEMETAEKCLAAFHKIHG